MLLSLSLGHLLISNFSLNFKVLVLILPAIRLESFCCDACVTPPPNSGARASGRQGMLPQHTVIPEPVSQQAAPVPQIPQQVEPSSQAIVPPQHALVNDNTPDRPEISTEKFSDCSEPQSASAVLTPSRAASEPQSASAAQAYGRPSALQNCRNALEESQTAELSYCTVSTEITLTMCDVLVCRFIHRKANRSWSLANFVVGAVPTVHRFHCTSYSMGTTSSNLISISNIASMVPRFRLEPRVSHCSRVLRSAAMN